MIKITNELVSRLSKDAKASVRKRINHNFHISYDEPVQRLLNAAEPGTYIRPHKHENPDKVEVFIILRGRVVVVEFDDKGKVTDHAILAREKGVYAAEIPPRVWHTFITLEAGSVIYEVKDGPYNKISDKNFAPWAPEENAPEASKYNDRIVGLLNIE